MSSRCKKQFSLSDITLLMANENIKDIQFQLIYTDDFIAQFRKKVKDGERPTKIFKDAGLPPSLIGTKRIERAASRWLDKA